MKLKVMFASAAFVAAFSLAGICSVRATSANAAPAAHASAAISDQPAASLNAVDEQNFAGKIVSQNGVRFILRDEQDNTWYHLDDQQQAGKFLGKLVNVTGTLDGQTDTIHVSSIAESKP